jgi:hypothetical protein
LLRITGDAGSDTRKCSREKFEGVDGKECEGKERKITAITISSDLALQNPVLPQVARKCRFLRVG